MKCAKHPSTISVKLTSVPELPYKKGLLNSSPKPKEKHNAKSKYGKNESMVLRSPPTGESIVRFALPIPLSKTKEKISADEMVRRIATNLKMVVSNLEDTYGACYDNGEKAAEKSEAEGLSVGDDLSSFLLCCSQFTSQLEEAVKEERGALESLYKWFQEQVNQMEEISRDQSNLEELQSDGKTASLNIVQIAKLARKFEDIKSRLKKRKEAMQTKQEDKETVAETLKHYGLMEKQIEEFITSHSALESQTETESQPGTPSVTTRMTRMIKIFENQSTMLEKALNDQQTIESKYKQLETDFQMLIMEKALLEGEIRRLREIERAKSAAKEEQTKKSGKSEKKKFKEKEKNLSPKIEFKSLEELLQIQKEAELLKTEKKTLQGQLKWALEEAERNKTQLEFVLHQKMEMFKEESKTKVGQSQNKSKVKIEDSKDSLPKKSDTQLGEQRKDQISSDQSKRPKKKQLADIDPSAIEDFPQETFKSFTVMPLIEEHRESISSQPNEEMAEASEQSEAEDIKGPLEIPSESSNEGNDLLPEDESPTMEQITDIGRYKSIYITAEPIDNMSLISRTQSEMETLEAINYDNVLNEGEEQDKKFGKDSDTGRRLKRKRSSKIGKLPTHEEKSDTVHYEEATKAKVPSKKRASDAYGDEAYESRGSVSKAHIQTKKQGTHQRGRSSASDAYGDEAYESRGSVTKAHIQTKKQETHRRGKGSVQEEESDTMHYEEVTGAKVPSKKRASDAYGDETYESRGSVTKAHTHTKKQGTHQRGKGSVHEEESDTMNYEEPRKSKISSRRKGFALPITNQVEMHSSESQGSISKSNTETKKQGTHKRGRGIASDAYGDEAYESQGSVTKAHIQTKKQGTHQRGKGSDADGALKPVNQGSDSKADTERKKHESSKGESTISKDSIPVLDEVQDKTFEHQESGLRLEVQAKKLTFGPQNIHNEESATDIKQEYQNVPSSSQVQLKKQKSLGGEIFTTHFVVPAESHAQLYQTYTPETQIERATTSGTGRLTTIPVEHPKKEASPDNLFPEKKLYITRAPTQTKKQYPPWDTNAETRMIQDRQRRKQNF